jgi:hypothetical protein
VRVRPRPLGVVPAGPAGAPARVSGPRVAAANMAGLYKARLAAGRTVAPMLASLASHATGVAAIDARADVARARRAHRAARVALRRGVALPPIQVVECCDGYYLLDGRHHVSVALATGWRDIEAHS